MNRRHRPTRREVDAPLDFYARAADVRNRCGYRPGDIHPTAERPESDDDGGDDPLPPVA